MSAAWRRLLEEIGRARDAGRAADFWWRDDDAARPDPALERLIALAQASQVPLALAAIPALAEPAAFARLPAGVAILQHGSDHRNRAAPGEKKSEFPDADPPAAAIARLAEARRRLAGVVGERLLPVLAPPWNRIPATHVAPLADAGFRGLSCYGPRRAAAAAPGLVQVNTHVDLVAWRTGRGFAGEDAVLAGAAAHLAAKREARADPAEATGWLSHHAVHDDAAWRFLERLFETLRAVPGVRWLGAQELFRLS
ncbi:MAG TPA: hypothetical protein VLV90_09505 [Burkholderiales bacterium]|nr:hypothetical protein [Burkholderiales bacterium]